MNKSLEKLRDGPNKGKVVWMDEFNVESCCQKDNLEGFKGIDGSWVTTFLKAPESFTKGMGFTPLQCKTCGKHWFMVSKGRWTVK